MKKDLLTVKGLSDPRCHLVWAPTYRKWVWQGAIRQRVRELFCEIVGHDGFEIEELEVNKDHVHLFLSFPPKYSISAVVGRGVLERWVFCSDGG
jgi:putative transposase